MQWLWRRPSLLLLGLLLIVLGGFLSLQRLPVNLFPNLNYPLINVATHYQAGTAEEVELLITRPLENALQGLPGLRRVRSISTAGFSQITVEFTWGLDVLSARQEVVSALAQAAPRLPAGAVPQLENIGTSLEMISTYTLSGGESPTALRQWAQYVLAPALTSAPGVAQVTVMGGGRPSLRVELDPLRMRGHHLDAGRVVEAIGQANVLASAGYLEAYGRDLHLSARGQIKDLDDLGQVSVGRDRQGRPLLLGQVARLYRGELPERYEVTVDRRPAVAFIVQKQPQASTVEVSREVDERLAELSPPAGARLEKFYDQADIIDLAYRNMRNQLLLGSLLAVLTLLWVLGRQRPTWSLAASMPLSIIGAFILMHWAGLSINLMTLGALTVSIGLINDDTVLVLENIFRHRQLSGDPAQAAMAGTREIVGADLAGTLTTLAAFVPLTFMSGLAGRLFLPFGLTFAFVLLLSLALSLTIIPWAAARWLPPAGAGFHLPVTWGSRWIAWVGRWNSRLLERLLRHRRATIALAMLAMAGSAALLAFNQARFFPLLDENSLLLSYKLAPGTALGESNRIGAELEKMLLAQPGVAAVYRRTGSPEDTTYEEGPSEGELILRLKPKSGLEAAEIKDTLDDSLEKIPGVLSRINDPTSEKLSDSFAGLPALFGITVFGNDLGELHRAAADIEQAARTTPGVANVVNNNKVPVDSLRLDIDRAACARRGVAPEKVAQALTLAVGGVEAGQSVVAGRVLHIFVNYAPADRRTPADLAQILVACPDGAAIPLGQLARLSSQSAYSSVERQYGSRTLTLTADITGNPYAVMRRLRAEIAKLELPPEVRFVFAGEFQELVQSAQEMVWILLASILLVYAIMALQLGNALDPVVVLVKLPIDFMGAAIALAVSRVTLDVTVLLGLVTLVGIAVNNGLVLLGFTGQLRRQGLDAASAVKEAVAVRLRPLLLTQLTAVLALLPAALGLGEGPQLLKCLGVMLFGGLTAGTFFTLNLIPVIYVATERWRR